MSEKDEHKIQYFGSASTGYGWRCTCGYGMKQNDITWAEKCERTERAICHLLDEGIVHRMLRPVYPDGVKPREDSKRRVTMKWR